MGYLSRYGTVWDQIPITAGRIFWVAPSSPYTINGRSYDASDGNDGLSPERALRTISRAWALVTANAGDVILLLPGTHTVSTASVAANVAGVKMFGMPGNIRQHETILTTDITADQIINFTAANFEGGHFTIRPITASNAFDLSAAADNFHLHHFGLDLQTPAVSTSTIGLTLAAANYIHLHDFYVECDGAQGNAIVATGALDSRIHDFEMQLSAGTWASAIITGAATSRLRIDHGYIGGVGTAITAAVNGTGATIAAGVAVDHVDFGSICTVPIDNYDAGECEINECYKLGVGATDGGTKITAIT